MIAAAPFLARAQLFTNYTLYGWSQEAWPSDTNTTLRGYNSHMVQPRAIYVHIATNAGSSYTNVYAYDSVTALRRDGGSGDLFIGSEFAGDDGDGPLPSVWLNYRDVRGWELAYALYSRIYYMPYIGDAPFECRPDNEGDTDFDCQTFPGWFYRRERANLACAKGIVAEICADFADVRELTNAVASWAPDPETADDFHGPWSGRAVNGIPVWTPQEICEAVGAPSNYLYYTPWRALSGVDIGYSRITTQCFAIGSSVTGAVSVVNVDLWGQPHTHTGTNGQVFCEIVTNDSIEAGYTTLDYGYRRIERIVSLLDQPVREPTTEGRSNIPADPWATGTVYDYVGFGTTTTNGGSWTNAKTSANLDFDLKAAGLSSTLDIYSDGKYRVMGNPVDTRDYAANTRSAYRQLSVDIEQEYCDVQESKDIAYRTNSLVYHFYARARTPTIGNAVFDGFGIFPTNDVFWAINGGDCQYDEFPIYGYVGFDSLPTPWTMDPRTDGYSVPGQPPDTYVWATSYGFLCTLSEGRWVLMPPWTFGARIDLPAMTTTSTTIPTTTSISTTTTTSSSTTTGGG
jgi:hypothetical protein